MLIKFKLAEYHHAGRTLRSSAKRIFSIFVVTQMARDSTSIRERDGSRCPPQSLPVDRGMADGLLYRAMKGKTKRLKAGDELETA